MDAGEDACLRGFRFDFLEPVEDKGLQVLRFHMHIVQRIGGRVVTQLREVHFVALYGIRRVAAFQTQVGVVLTQECFVRCYRFGHSRSES